MRDNILFLLIVLVLLAAGATNAEVWGVKTPASTTEPPSVLFRFAEDGSDLAIVGPVTVAGDSVVVDGLGIREDGLLCGFVLVMATSQLVIIDPATAVATPVGEPLAFRRIRGAAFTTAGVLMAIDVEFDALLSIDPATGLETAPAVPLTLDGQPFVPGSSCDLAIDQAGLAMVTAGELDVYTLDLTTGALTLLYVDSLPGEDGSLVSGAGFAIGETDDASLYLFDVNRDDDIYSYHIDENYARQLVYADILAEFNAGRGDLASRATGQVSGVGGAVVAAVRMLPNSPNPFNPRTTLNFELARPGTVDLRVYDVAGRLVRVLRDAGAALPAGRHQVDWDGADDGGRRLPSGVYVARLVASGESTARTVTLVE
ncbi:MAG TPA: FlgD immunoglobulin-like domain containing protein [Candidatus Krumholzibacteria bacterium]|nr:FlgD immunoglobulin-like domain containing protein [Candidatus Krumholzibacteria bacterium]HPD73098.1 FlgD immunoglobulin-like domain containing protein [Candidatus Krumholzibacteria bacterium]HRY41898.1 FlgD immunoglobulin-like domain containing protein [Candidatus Krumholzibacteria bacterium]